MTVKNYAYPRYAVKKALERGDLVKLDYCEVCGDRPTFGAETHRIVAHHWHGYVYPIDVWWVCTSCNVRLPNDGSLKTPEEALQYIQRPRNREQHPEPKPIHQPTPEEELRWEKKVKEAAGLLHVPYRRTRKE